MKMVCPHCGVKGSADDSLLGRKVKCPKCFGIFKVDPELVQPIAIEDFELEQLETAPGQVQTAETITDEVDDVFNDIFGEEKHFPSEDEAGDLKLSADDSALIDILQEDFRDGLDNEQVAALSDLEKNEEDVDDWRESSPSLFASTYEDSQEATGKKGFLEGDDDTLTVIEDSPDDVGIYSAETQTPAAAEDILSFDDEWEKEKNSGPEFDPQSDFDDSETKGDPTEYEVVDEIISETADDSESTDRGDAKERSDLENADREDTVQKCSACGEYVDPASKHEYGANVYCATCVPVMEPGSQFLAAAPAFGKKEVAVITAPPTAATGKFTVATLIKDSWHYVKGIKGAVWAALVVMTVILFAVGAASVFLLPALISSNDGTTLMAVDVGSQIVVSFLSYIFTAGIVLMAVRKVAQQPYSWKMVFSGFKKTGVLVLAVILQTLLVLIGICLFVLPGIYLSVGYLLTFPLIMEKGLSPWQAMEASRKAIHKRWWTVFFTLIALAFLSLLSAIPAGIGLIWTVPMFFVLVAVLYHHFFGDDE